MFVGKGMDEKQALRTNTHVTCRNESTLYHSRADDSVGC